MTKRMPKVGIVVLMGLLVLAVGVAPAQKTKGKSRLAQTKYLMRGINQTNCGALAKLLKGSGPADDKSWELAVQYASCLNEMSYLLMDDGRCPDGDWAGAAKLLREGSAEVLAAATEQDLEAAQGAFKKVTRACESCHSKHRTKK
jgi:cytochrome c556